MNRLLFLISILVFTSVFAQDDNELYDHDLDENKWEKIRDNIRYEGHDRKNSAGKEWTYEDPEEYEKVKESKGGGGGGHGTGGPGDGASVSPEESTSSSSPPPPRSSRSKRSSSGGFMALGWLGYLILAAFIGALIFLIFYLFINAPKKGKKINQEEEELENLNPTEISLTELERMLQEALDRGDYRGAVRVYFTFIIRDLAEKKWIHWEKEKTNFHYLREMSGKQFFDDFNRAVSYFEVIWYGKRELDKDKFNLVKSNFTNLLNKLGVK